MLVREAQKEMKNKNIPEKLLAESLGGQSGESLPRTPPEVTDVLDDAETKFNGNVGLRRPWGFNCAGERWKEEKRGGGAVAESSVIPGSSARAFRSYVDVRCPRRSDCASRLMNLITDYSARPQWDSGIESGAVTQQYLGGEEVVEVATKGSTISSRWWRDVRRRSSIGGGGDGCLRNVSCAAPELGGDGGGKAPSGKVKGVNHAGGGSAILRCPKTSPTHGNVGETDCWRVVMVGHSDIGGWVPTSVVNSASSGGYHNTALALAKQATTHGCEILPEPTPQ